MSGCWGCEVGRDSGHTDTFSMHIQERGSADEWRLGRCLGLQPCALPQDVRLSYKL